STPLPLEPAKSVSLIPLDQWAGGGVPANVQTGEHLPKAPLNWRGNIIPSPYALALTNRPWPSRSVGGGTIPRRWCRGRGFDIGVLSTYAAPINPAVVYV